MTTTNNTTLTALADTITTDQIRAFEAAAGAAGDAAMVRICRRAADGSQRARREVARAMLAARAMHD